MSDLRQNVRLVSWATASSCLDSMELSYFENRLFLIGEEGSLWLTVKADWVKLPQGRRRMLCGSRVITPETFSWLLEVVMTKFYKSVARMIFKAFSRVLSFQVTDLTNPTGQAINPILDFTRHRVTVGGFNKRRPLELAYCFASDTYEVSLDPFSSLKGSSLRMLAFEADHALRDLS